MPQYVGLSTASSDSAYLPFVDTATTTITFKARYVRIENTGSSDGIYVNLCSTTATTDDYQIVAGSTAALTISSESLRFSGISVTTTAAAAPPFKVLAIG